MTKGVRNQEDCLQGRNGRVRDGHGESLRHDGKDDD